MGDRVFFFPPTFAHLLFDFELKPEPVLALFLPVEFIALTIFVFKEPASRVSFQMTSSILHHIKPMKTTSIHRFVGAPLAVIEFSKSRVYLL